MIMDIKSHIPLSNKDESWYNHYMSKIGEANLYRMRDYIYNLCDKIQVGERINILVWINQTHKKCTNFKEWKHEDTTDLFIKLIWCYMTESDGEYCFSNDYTHFRHYTHARTLDKQSSLHQREYQDKNTRANGRGTWMQTIRVETIPASKTTVYNPQ